MKPGVAHIVQDLEDCGLIGKSIIVGVSGGRDSMLLLHYLRTLPLRLHVAHVNYGLRKEAGYDENLVRRYCDEYGIPISVCPVQSFQKHGMSVQERARAIRYEFFEQLRQSQDATAVAVAHHEEDQLETILFQFLRGGGLASMRGMRRFANGLWRPMLHMTRENIDEQIFQFQIPYCDDATNFEDNYARNRLRHRVVPELNAVVPQWRQAVLQRAVVVQEIESFLESNQVATDAWLTSMADGSHRLDMAKLLAMPLPKYSLWRWTESIGLPTTAVDTLIQLWNSRTGSVVDFKEWRFLKEREYLRVVTTTESPMEHQIISFQDLPCEVGDWYLERTRYDAVADQLGADAIAMRLDAIVWPLEIRPPQSTDEIQPFGMQGHKRIVRLLIEKKIEQTDKRQARVWAYGSTIYWLEGMVVSELCRAGAGDDVVLIRKKERQLKP